MQNGSFNAAAGPTLRKPFISAEHRPEQPDGIFRVLLISSGSVASVKIPDIVSSLTKDKGISVQVVATKSSLHFYAQSTIDQAILASLPQDIRQIGGKVKVWTDEDEWSDWSNLGDPILHIELRRWADLVVVAPCSADFLAKLAAGICDNLPLSIMRALPRSTPVIICPAMNTYMFEHPFTADHLKVLQDKLGYLILGPQGSGTLACGDAGAGKMTDWRDIVDIIRNFSLAFQEKQQQLAEQSLNQPIPNPQSVQAIPSAVNLDAGVPPSHPFGESFGKGNYRTEWPGASLMEQTESPPSTVRDPGLASTDQLFATGVSGREHWTSLTGPNGDGKSWQAKFWMG